ncbi:hypothetical protein HZS_4720, partial [Henneguya salminicola]
MGQRIYLIKKCLSWYYAMVIQGSFHVYFTIPVNYVKLIPARSEPSKMSSTIYYEKDLISQLISNVLHGWINAMKNVSQNYTYFKPLSNIPINQLITLIRELVSIRMNIMDPNYKINLPNVVKLINEGNVFFDLEYIPFSNDKFVNITNTTLNEIFNIHSEQFIETTEPLKVHFFFLMEQPGSVGSISDFLYPPTKQNDSEDFHVLISLQNVFCELADPSIWIIGIYDSTSDTYVTEKYIVNFKDPIITKEKIPLNDSALFELTRSNILHGLILFIRIYRIGPLLSERKTESQSFYKRPFGFAAYSMNEMLKTNTDAEYKEKIPILLPEESDFGNIEKAFSKDTMSTAKLSLTFGFSIPDLEICLRSFNDNLQKIKLEHPEIFNEDLTLIPCAGMPDIITPGGFFLSYIKDRIQNDFYLTLRGVTLDKFISKGKPMNIEAAITAWTTQGQLLTNCIKSGHGKDIGLQTEYKSAVLYHTSHPVWNETISIKFPSNRMENVILLITFAHISSSVGKSKFEKMTTLGFTVIKFQNNDDTMCGNTESSYFIKKIETQGGGKGMQLS